MCWQYSGVNSKLNAEMKHLTRNFLDDDEYKREDVRIYDNDSTNPFHTKNGWHESTVQIRLPKEKMKWASEDEAPVLEIPGVYHHSLTDAYSSPAFSEAYEEVNSLPRESDDDLECIIASLIMWLDAIHLMNFGNASLWLFYLFFGNQSKYTRGKLMAPACHHVAYILSIPSDFQDTYFNIFADASSSDIHTHCHLGTSPQ
ncbi:hypothetical protein BDR03DRAFT_987033 [Suillus americanus]|nr:hypothetical protein BDR03DRAFT_987033 [Suillus americanus]